MLLAAVDISDLPLYSSRSYTVAAAHTTTDALRLLSHLRPSAVVLDWDAPDLDGAVICHAGRAYASILVTTIAAHAPAALRAGCHGVLLKPFAPNLLAGRVGRMLRDAAERDSGGDLVQQGTNRVWNEVPCDRCGTPGATSFDYSSYRRMWYACLSCEHVWLGPRRE